jgi:N-dimethylarginine dimethylaminohydrolase
MQKVIKYKHELTSDFQSLPSIPLPKKVLMVSPSYFNIDNSINPHMQKQDGSLQIIDKDKAIEQWYELKKIYEKLNFNVFVVDGVKDLLDMVFCANQSFPFMDSDGNFHAVLSNMFDDRRNLEVEAIASFLTQHHYETHSIGERQKGCYFESMGDALWLNGKKFILGGYGFRTDQQVYETLSKVTNSPVALFELKKPKFYHLDTCLSILNSKTALACKEAFTDQGWELLNAIFPNLLSVPLVEADSPYFACNAHCPDEKHVIIQSGCQKTIELIKQQGFTPIEVNTSEFIKSGGSVFCMKLMFW